MLPGAARPDCNLAVKAGVPVGAGAVPPKRRDDVKRKRKHGGEGNGPDELVLGLVPLGVGATLTFEEALADGDALNAEELTADSRSLGVSFEDKVLVGPASACNVQW